MESSNPALNNRAIDALRRSAAGTGTMTVGGTAIKTVILLLVTTFSAAMVWTADPSVYGTAMIVGTIGGLVFALATSFKPQWAPITAPLYAVLEGLALGAISALYNAQAYGLPATAVAATMVTAIAMFTLYRTGVIKVTEKMRAVASMALLGLLGVYLLQFILGFFGNGIPGFGGSGLLGIGVSVFATGLAAFFLLLDMDRVEQMAKSGLPKSMEWYGAFAFLVTLVWLYLEMLRLLSKLQRR
ncbi:MAG TPA: Bax inhibitor-1/YccA family protein [Gemmatimonas sp.]|nr:Bax inhibitor-1/YccA family protein [Gemmatimonas sp.]